MTLYAATIIEQRPSGRHYARWTIRLNADTSKHGGFLVYNGGADPFWYASETEALDHFNSAVTVDAHR